MKRVTLLLLLSTAACHSDMNDKQQDNAELLIIKKNAVSQASASNKAPLQQGDTQETGKHSLTILRESELLTKKMNITLNGEKFTSTKSILRKGDNVFNLSMSEFGVLKGSFVVVTRADTRKLILENYSVELIATNTFRLVPMVTDSALIELSKMLNSRSDFSSVEVEIDYSKQSPMLDTY